MDNFMNNPQLMQLLQDPEVMQMMSEPGMMERIQEMMQNPQLAMSDPRLMNLMMRLGGSMGGGMGGMGGMGAGAGMGAGSGGNTTQNEDLGLMQKVSSLSQYNYRVKEAIQKQQPIVVDFTMQGCRPCAMLKPEMIKMSKEFPELLFLLVDNRSCPEVVEDLHIEGFPTVLFYSTLGGNLTKKDTVVGMDLIAIQSNINRLKQDIEQKKRQLLFKNFKHFPIRESEITYFKQIQWDKLQTKIETLLKDLECPEILYKPFTDSSNNLQDNFSTSNEMLIHCTDLLNFLKNFISNSMLSIKPIYLKVLSILLEWPEEHLSVGLHIFRMASFHADFASQFAKGGCKGPSFNNILQRICIIANEKCCTNSLNSVLICRGICNCFEKKILTKILLQSIDDILGVITAVCLSNQDDNVITSAMALLLNTSYMIYCYSPTTIQTLDKQQIMINYQKSILTTIIETTPLFIDENKSQHHDAIYKLFIAMGTVLFPYYLLFANIKDAKDDKTNATNPITIPSLDIKQHLDSIGFKDQIKTWTDALSENKNIQAASKELELITQEFK